MEWWDRLQQLTTVRGLTPEQVAERAGVPVKSVYGYLKGQVLNPRGSVMVRLAAAVGTTEGYLRLGSAGSQIIDLRKIPLLTMNEIGTLKPDQSIFDVWDGVALVAVPVDVPEGSFGVLLDDDSGAPEFAKSDVIICHTKAERTPGRFVIAVVEGMQRAFFGRYRPSSIHDATCFQLVPTNTNYPTIDIGGAVAGHVVARALKHVRSI